MSGQATSPVTGNCQVAGILNESSIIFYSYNNSETFKDIQFWLEF